jgi:hypothetical protein
MGKEIRFDVGTFSKAKRTKQGYLKADAYLTRTGIFEYIQDNKIIKELRPPEEVFKEDSIDTLRSSPATEDHPPKFLDVKNTSGLTVGYVSEEINKQDIYLKALLTVTDEKTIQKIDNKEKTQISCGYTCEIDKTPGTYNGERYDQIQRNIEYNHVAIVSRGRAGSEVAIKMDSAEEFPFAYMRTDSEDKTDLKSKEGENKNMVKIKIDSIEFDNVDATLAKTIQEKIDSLKNKENQFQELQGKFVALESENKKVKEDLQKEKESKIDRAEILKQAKERIDIESFAKEVSDKIDTSDRVSDIELKKSILIHMDSSLQDELKDKSEPFVEGVFQTKKKYYDSNKDSNHVTKDNLLNKNQPRKDYMSQYQSRMINASKNK